MREYLTINARLLLAALRNVDARLTEGKLGDAQQQLTDVIRMIEAVQRSKP